MGASALSRRRVVEELIQTMHRWAGDEITDAEALSRLLALAELATARGLDRRRASTRLTGGES